MNLWHKMNLPNKVTMVRFLMVPVFVLVVSLWHGWAADLLAGLLFIVAACTDFVDGHLARSRNLVTTFGKFMDPLADKVLVMTAMVCFCAMGRFPRLGADSNHFPGVCRVRAAAHCRGGREGYRRRVVGEGKDRLHHGVPVPDAPVGEKAGGAVFRPRLL